MSRRKVVDTTPEDNTSVGPFTVYSAGGLFTQDELATNILIKEAVWRNSNGKFHLDLPQSREMKELDRDDLEAYIRNDDLLHVMQADILLARYDGLELDSGTVVEFALAKFLGKPTVILRTDFRSTTFIDQSEPYNLMVKNWPRTVSIHLHSYMLWAKIFAEENRTSDKGDPDQMTMQAELGTLQKSVEEIAAQVVDGFEAVLEMKSPYPPDYQETVYKAARFCPGSGFDQMVTARKVDEIIQRLRNNGTL
jgi:nucleoside 2-deoxyribosyltransferase